MALEALEWFDDTMVRLQGATTCHLDHGVVKPKPSGTLPQESLQHHRVLVLSYK